MEDGGNEGLKSNEKLVPESELKKARKLVLRSSNVLLAERP